MSKVDAGCGCGGVEEKKTPAHPFHSPDPGSLLDALKVGYNNDISYS